MKVDFCHLHLHTQYSMQDSLCRLEALFQQAQEMGMQALAMTDHHRISGVVEFYQKARQYGIKPLIGCELRVGSILTTQSETRSVYHLTVLATSHKGYQNLLHLLTYSNRKNQGIVPRQMLEEWHQDLICLSGCRESEVDEWIFRDQSQAKMIIQQYCQLFGRENYYLELQRFGAPREDELIREKVRIARGEGVPLIATNNVHYLKRKDWEGFQTLQNLQEMYLKKDRNEFYLKSPAEMALLFRDLPDALDNTVRIAERCQLELKLEETHWPHFRPPTDQSANDYLRDLCQKALERRYGCQPPGRVVRGLARELELIQKLGYTDYFLLIWDLVQMAKMNDTWLVGRGKVGSSLVSYLLEITHLDPLEHQLEYESGPTVASAVELVIDPQGAELLIKQLIEKYGVERMAFLPDIVNLSLPEMIHNLTSLQGWSKEEHLSLTPLLSNTNLLNGLPWEFQLNPCKIVIAPEALTHYTALDFLGDDLAISQLPPDGVAQLGLLQLHLAPNRFLAAVHLTCKSLENRGVPLEYRQIPLDDLVTYQQLRRGKTNGCYLLGEAGCGQILEQLQPQNFSGLVFVIALDHLEKKQEGLVQYLIEKAGEYAHPYLEELLDDTYGVIVYEEQLALLGRELAGFSGPDAQQFSEILQEKDPLQVAHQKSKFVRGVQNRKITVMEATFLFDQMYHQVEHLLSKADLIFEAQLAYQTAYLKTHYRVEYLSSLFQAKLHI